MVLPAISRNFKEKFGENGFTTPNKIFGTIMIGFGIAVFARPIIGE